MKGIHIFLVLLLFVSSTSVAQNKGGEPPWVSFGKLKYAYANGTWAIPNLSAEDILANPRLEVNQPGYKITSFDFSITTPHTGYFGPYRVTGAELSDQAKEILKANSRGTGTIYIENMKAIGPDKRARTFASMIVRYSN
jgi:hypothetical protein